VKRDIFHLEYILDEIAVLRDIIGDKELEEFLEDETLKRAVSKTLENIGESVKSVSERIKSEYPDTDWRNISGLRDIITHRYHGIDHLMIWDVYSNKIDDLEEQVNEILSKIKALDNDEDHDLD
jgi:uncharacterized protein with HEPN domain